jgi:hypothetical protein
MRRQRKVCRTSRTADWGDPEQAVGVERRVLEARRTPIGALQGDQIAMLLRQKVGLPTLLLRALDILGTNLTPAEEMYPGELLLAVMSADENQWHDVPVFRHSIIGFVERAQALAKQRLDAMVDGHTQVVTPSFTTISSR